jgi:glucokinase
MKKNEAKKKILGIDIGGTKCSAILGEYSALPEEIRIKDKIQFPTESEKGLDRTLSGLFKSLEKLLCNNHLKAEDAVGIGISCGGPLDSKKGIIMSPPNLIGWDNVGIVEIFEERFGIRTYLQNDANACALAEWKFGAGRGKNNIIFLTFGTGMGAGFILDGKLYSGTSDMAGEIGHVRMEGAGPVGYGKAGSFEGYCSGGGIAQLARTMVLEKLQTGQEVSFCPGIEKINDLSAKEIADAAFAGDGLAIEIFKTTGRYLGRGLAMLMDILNPEAIIIGSIFHRARSLLWPEAEKEIMKEALEQTRRTCEVVEAELGEQIGDYAALAVAVSNIRKD